MMLTWVYCHWNQKQKCCYYYYFTWHSHWYEFFKPIQITDKIWKLNDILKCGIIFFMPQSRFFHMYLYYGSKFWDGRGSLNACTKPLAFVKRTDNLSHTISFLLRQWEVLWSVKCVVKTTQPSKSSQPKWAYQYVKNTSRKITSMFVKSFLTCSWPGPT